MTRSTQNDNRRGAVPGSAWGREVASLVLLLSLAVANNARAITPDSSPPSAAAGKPEETFDILEFRVLGNTVLPPIQIERAVYPHEGFHKSFKDIEAARAALENAYHQAGYGTVFVDIPEQDIGDGVVRLHASEGRIDRIRVTGARYFSNRQLLASIPSLQPGGVPQLPALQSDLAQVNAASGDRAVTPILKAGRTPGTVDIDLHVNDKLPLHASVTTNDRYTPNTTHLRTIFDLSYGNLFQDFHNLSFEYQTAPQSSPTRAYWR